MCPPGTDQTTRSSQRWTLLAPLLKQRLPLSDSHCGSNVFVNLKQRQRFHMFSLLHRPESLPLLKWEDALASCQHERNTAFSAMERLPSEILNMIFQELVDDVTSVLSLGLCSLGMWRHLLRCVPAKPTCGRFANTPIINTGSYLTSLPDAIYEILPHVKDEQERYDDAMDQGMRWYGPCPVRRWNWDAYSSFEDLSETAAKNMWLDAFDGIEKVGMSVSDVDALRQSLGLVSREAQQAGHGQWLLRNLTTKEYVRLSGEPPSAPHSSDPEANVASAPWLTVDAALMLQTFCTWDDGYGQGPQGCGAWAGHRFDIVGREKPTLDEEDWVDSTDRVISDANEQGFAEERADPRKTPTARRIRQEKPLRRSTRLQGSAVQV